MATTLFRAIIRFIAALGCSSISGDFGIGELLQKMVSAEAIEPSTY